MSRARYTRFLIPALSALTMLIMLIGLGTWQVYRLRWKEAVLAQIATAEAALPVALTESVITPYTKIAVTGHLAFDHAADFGADVRDTKTGATMGFHQIVPLDREGLSPILVDRGWAPQKREAPLNNPPGATTVIGYARPAEMARWFSPVDDEAGRHFYTLNPATIGAAIGVPNLAPFILVALGPATPNVFPVPAQQLPLPANNHLTYAITWYGLAMALIVIFSVWLRKALRS